jgi:hypothetical protein
MALLRRLTIVLLLLSAALPAQRRTDPRNSYYRVIAVVPLIAGANGAAAWPKHVPTALPEGSSAPAIIAFASELSDDGQHAVVELVGVNRAALADVLADKSILAFEKSRVSQQEIEAAVRAFRKDFSLSRFGVAVQ